MTILALDQSSKTTGWAIFKEGKLIDSGIFSFTDKKISMRLVKIKNKILKFIQEYKVDEVILEDIQLQTEVTNNVQTFKALAEVYGVITETLEELKIPFETVYATVWKSKLGIKGYNRSVQKKNAQKYVSEIFKKEVSEDESDAICIGDYKLKIQNEMNWD